MTNTPLQNLIEMITDFEEKGIKMTNKSILLALINSLEDESAMIKQAEDKSYGKGFNKGFERASEISLEVLRGRDNV
jgi:hypothetical protein